MNVSIVPRRNNMFSRNPTQVERVQGLAPECFVTDFVSQNRPVVVTDALVEWNLAQAWTPECLNHVLGQEQVQLYNNYFDLTDVTPLSTYLEQYFGRSGQSDGYVPYVRWYAKFRDVDFIWSDEAFVKIRSYWDNLYFLPKTDFVLPFAPPPTKPDPTVDPFPAKGLFISAAGARTSLHVDPWCSDAVLCQLYGRKHWKLYNPEQAGLLCSGNETVDLDAPDREKFRLFGQARPDYEFLLEAGESVYVPHGWFHHVETQTDSISLTWNFVHAAGAGAFLRWLDGPISEFDESVLRFFYAPVIGSQVTLDDVRRLVCPQAALSSHPLR